VPIEGGRLLLVRRATEPLGLCCPGGFLEFGEEWSEGCVRELAEETGIIVPAQSMSLHTVITSAPPEQTIVIFGLTPELRETDLLDFMANSEVSELVIVDAAPAELAFSNHAQVVCTFFS
jgi:ADP-ribose pyrophosphatase YjhB (NUDIX family)